MNVDESVFDASALRTSNLFNFVDIPDDLKGRTICAVPRGSGFSPGKEFSVVVANAGKVWLLAMDLGSVGPGPGWKLTSLSAKWKPSDGNSFSDKVYEKKVSAGEHVIAPEAVAQSRAGIYSIPHALIIEKQGL